jgi:hypothetical protein
VVNYDFENVWCVEMHSAPVVIRGSRETLNEIAIRRWHVIGREILPPTRDCALNVLHAT